MRGLVIFRIGIGVGVGVGVGVDDLASMTIEPRCAFKSLISTICGLHAKNFPAVRQVTQLAHTLVVRLGWNKDEKTGLGSLDAGS